MNNSLILFLLFTCLSSFSQNFEEKFRNKTWHSNGDIMRSETFTVTTEPITNLIEDIEFLSEGNLDITMKPEDLKVIFSYEFLNDNLRLYSTVKFTESGKTQESSIYYKVKEINSKTVELIPIKEIEHK